MKVFFATDIHGSEICWRKFLNAAAFYKADLVVLGGDVTGKVLVPILAMPGHWEVTFAGKRLRLETRAELDEIQRKIRDRGSYPAVMVPCVLATKIDAVVWQIPDMNRAVFNFHAPPYGTGLDEAPALDENMRPILGGTVMKPVGSKAVREAILKYQPPLSVHGHIHESRGVAKMGRTLTVNPGSSYGDGVLQAALLDINMKNGKVKYVLVNG